MFTCVYVTTLVVVSSVARLHSGACCNGIDRWLFVCGMMKVLLNVEV